MKMSLMSEKAEVRSTEAKEPSVADKWDGDTPTSEASPGIKPVSLKVLALLGAGYLALAFIQSPGRVEDDTKLPLIVEPVSYIESALHVWNQTVFGGTVQLGTGFIIPTGLFYAVAHLLHIPLWVAERIWIATLLTVACWGIVRLSEALGIGNRFSRVLAGVAYCAAPIFLTWADTTAALCAVVFLPWMLRPLVIGSREGSPRRAAARSGIAALLMGGANAAVLAAVFPLGVIWLLTRRPGPRRRSLALWWVVAMVMACTWWLVSTAFVAKYGYNYLRYSETSTITTSTASVFESLRGASYWLDYFHLGGPALPGAWILVSSWLAILGTATVAALGLAGLCQRIPEKLFLVASLCFGVVMISAGYSGASGGPFAPEVQHLLQGPLDVIRNIGKFSPDVTLPLVLGLAWAVSATDWSAVRHRAIRFIPGGPRSWRGLVSILAVVAIAIALAPFLGAKIYQASGFTTIPSGFSSIPSYWTQAGEFLNAHQGHENALVVPASSFANYTWGNPEDEPLQVVANTSLEWRNLIPQGSNGYTQMLDVVEQALDSGTSPPGFAQYLAREGIDYVVEANDRNQALSGAPPPALVHQVLAETPGLTEVASYGRRLPVTQTAAGSLQVYNSPSYTRLRPVEIFRVDSATSAVATYPAVDPVVVSGDLGSLVPLGAEGVISGRAAVLSGDPAAAGVSSAKGATWAITDGNQRVDHSFGLVRDANSYVLGSNQSLNPSSSVPMSFAVVNGVSHQTVETPIGAASVASSSYGSVTLADAANQGPAAAFDQFSNTVWVANDVHNSVGQWVSITFKHPVHLTTISVSPLIQPESPKITRVQITTDRGTVTRTLSRGRRSGSLTIYRLSVPLGYSRHLKVTIAATKPPKKVLAAFPLGAGITGIAIPGVTFVPQLKLPDDEASTFQGADRNAPVVSFNRPILNANLSLGPSSPEDPTMARSFVLPKNETATASGYAVPVPSESLESLLELLQPVPSTGLKITATSVLGGLPRFRAYNLVNGSTSPWIADFDNKDPALDVSWSGVRPVSSIRLSLTSQASRPTEISVTPGGGSPMILHVPKNGGLITFPSTNTESLKIQFLKVATNLSVTPDFGVLIDLPVGLSSLSIPGLSTATIHPIDPAKAFKLPCGDGPTVYVNGKPRPTTVSGTVAGLINLQPVPMTVCSSPGGLMKLPAGSNSFATYNPNSEFEITSLAIQAVSPQPHRSAAAERTATLEQWNAASKKIEVGAGPATYLAIPQNFSAGWVATLGDQTLKSVRLDGWQQGYLVPAGKAGTVVMTMKPDTLFRFLLAVGAVFILGLFALALIPSRRRYDDDGGRRPPLPFWFIMAASLVVLGLVAGPLALVAIPLLLIARRWGRDALTITAFVAFMLAGVAAAWSPAMLSTVTAGALERPAQVASVVALAAVLCALIVEERSRRRQGRTEGNADPSLSSFVTNSEN
ncbi:alpha-(1-_3)-arabinofuranosyltransferase domain-containing protein [Mycobacterium sp.]|uniref:alpha-(1->3)-arabinofuranosyltransferase domain-containing protein n=1 Tax=Mycobacterium sp. TaxID=1785 RepID=UPI003F96BDA5